MKYAIIKTGAGQTRVEEGRLIVVDRLGHEVGDAVTFDALLLADDSGIKIGTPVLPTVTVTGTVVEHFRGEKIRVFKYKPKVRQRKTKGHRQEYTRVRIESIAPTDKTSGGRKKKAAEETSEEA